MYLTNWIDKRLGEIQGDTIFQNFFKGIEIEEIEGTFYLDNRQLGIDIVFSDALIATSVHLHAFSSDYKEYKGDMPFELLFSMARSTVKEKNNNRKYENYSSSRKIRITDRGCSR